MKEIEFLNEEIANSILEKIELVENLAIISFFCLYSYLSEQETELVKKFLRLNPRKYGFKCEFFGIKKVPKRNLLAIKNQKYSFEEKEKTVKTQFLSLDPFLAFEMMNQALKSKIGRGLLISSGYRSPAYQIVLFLQYFKLNGFDFFEALRRVTLPGYSEHHGPKQAIDFMTVFGFPPDKNPTIFEETEEFKWLSENAGKFGFHLSYPKNNGDGIMYEPWHWRFESP